MAREGIGLYTRHTSNRCALCLKQEKPPCHAGTCPRGDNAEAWPRDPGQIARTATSRPPACTTLSPSICSTGEEDSQSSCQSYWNRTASSNHGRCQRPGPGSGHSPPPAEAPSASWTHSRTPLCCAVTDLVGFL